MSWGGVSVLRTRLVGSQVVLPTPDQLAAIDGYDIAAFMELADGVGDDYDDVLHTAESSLLALAMSTAMALSRAAW